MYKVFIVEDDENILSIISERLNKWGLNTFCATKFENILEEFTKIHPHLVLLDINLPYYDGFYWCEQIRKVSNVSIIFISSREENSDKIRAITSGGDDYIEKPFSIDLLVAKIKGALRRAYSYNDNSYNLVSYKNIILDIEKLLVKSEEIEVALSGNECRILSLLIKASGKLVTRSQIMKNLWKDEHFVDENTLTVNINRLRKKLKQINDYEIIETVKGKGYKLV